MTRRNALKCMFSFFQAVALIDPYPSVEIGSTVAVPGETMSTALRLEKVTAARRTMTGGNPLPAAAAAAAAVAAAEKTKTDGETPEPVRLADAGTILGGEIANPDPRVVPVPILPGGMAGANMSMAIAATGRPVAAGRNPSSGGVGEEAEAGITVPPSGVASTDPITTCYRSGLATSPPEGTRAAASTRLESSRPQRCPMAMSQPKSCSAAQGIEVRRRRARTTGRRRAKLWKRRSTPTTYPAGSHSRTAGRKVVGVAKRLIIPPSSCTGKQTLLMIASSSALGSLTKCIQTINSSDTTTTSSSTPTTSTRGIS